LRGEFGNEDTQINYVSLAQFNLRDPGDLLMLEKLIEETGAQFVVIDALADVMPGGDENTVKDVQPVFVGLRKIAEESRAAICLIHHTTKATGDYRGSSAISGAVDLLVMIKSREGSSIIDFEVKKARDVESFKFSAQAHWSDGQFWMTPYEKTVSPYYSKSEQYVIRFLDENGPSTVNDIKSHADTCSENAAKQAIYSLAGKDVVKRVDPGGPGEVATYALLDENKGE
jgi:hypothetical protein